MLKRLTIRNYALIRSLEMEPAPDLNVITGETGAGKSIMLGAIGLLTGNRADTRVLWDTKQKCITEGIFDVRPYHLQDIFEKYELDYEDLAVIRREISPAGKSRAFVNDTPVTLDVMRHIGSLLLDIHSQHENLLPGQLAFQLKLIDAYAGNEKVRKVYADSWSAYQSSKRAYEALSRQAEQLRSEEDYVRFQLDELVSADFRVGEQETLEAEVKIMENAGEIQDKLQQAISILTQSEYAARSSLASARGLLNSIAAYGKPYHDLLKRVDSQVIELDDIASEMESLGEKIDFDPERAASVRERLDTLYRLQKKHHARDIAELIAIRDQFQHRADQVTSLDADLATAKEQLQAAIKSMHEAAASLSASRKKAFNPLMKEIGLLLKELGMPEAQLEVNYKETPPGESGVDHVDLLFSANKGIPPRPLAQVASGGEFSRLMLCIKYVLASRTAIPTLILDEIDSGVSGEVAIKLGTLMRKMSRDHQLITITHLPQIAAKGTAHYQVFKDNSADKTVSNIRLLSKEDRIREIAGMIGGAKPTATALAGARELVEGE